MSWDELSCVSCFLHLGRLSITTSSYVALEVQLMRSPWSTSGRGSFLWHSNTRAWTWPCTLRQLPLSLSSRSWAHCNLVAAGSRFKDFTSIHIHRMVYALYNVGESVLPCDRHPPGLLPYGSKFINVFTSKYHKLQTTYR